jgi:DNA-binding response OmpR family regulator
VGVLVEATKSVLIVDDEPQIGRIFGIKLKLAGYDVITTTEGSEAIELIRTRDPNIVLLDMLMPDISGIDVINEVRTFSQIPIVVFTAKPEMVEPALRSGANDFIIKPCDPDQVINILATVLNSQTDFH